MMNITEASAYRAWWFWGKVLWIAIIAIQTMDRAIFRFGPQGLKENPSWASGLHTFLFSIGTVLIVATIPCWLGMLRERHTVSESYQKHSFFYLLLLFFLWQLVFPGSRLIQFWIIAYSFTVIPVMLWYMIKDNKSESRKHIEARLQPENQVPDSPKEQSA